MSNKPNSKSTIDEVIKKQISDSTSTLLLNKDEQEFTEKFSLLIKDCLSLARYGASLPYLSKSLELLLSKNEDNILLNPFFKIAMTMEDATFNAFILNFANLFNTNSPKEDTYTIRSLVRCIGKFKNGVIVINTNLPSLIKNNFKTRELCKNVLGFFDDKNNKSIIDSFANLRNHEIGHSTIKPVDYTLIESNLNHFIEFIFTTVEGLYDILDIQDRVLIRQVYEEDRDRWGFFLNNVILYSEVITSDDFTHKIVNAFNKAKSNTRKV
jgi:hypothetical protein